MILFLLFISICYPSELKITASTVKTYSREKLTLFKGNVKMNLDKLTVESDEAEFNQADGSLNFKGDVKINFKDQRLIGRSDVATYHTEKKMLELSGRPSLIYLLESTGAVEMNSDNVALDLEKDIFNISGNIKVKSDYAEIVAASGTYDLRMNVLKLNDPLNSVRISYKDIYTGRAKNLAYDISHRSISLETDVSLSCIIK